MTLRKSNQSIARAPALNGDGMDSIPVIGEHLVVAGALASGDVVEMIAQPAGTVLTGFRIIANQVDSNGSPTLAMDIGYLSGSWLDADGAGRTCGTEFGSAVTTVGRLATSNVDAMANATAANLLAAATTNDRSIGFKLTAAAATLVAGSKIRFIAHFAPVPTNMATGW